MDKNRKLNSLTQAKLTKGMAVLVRINADVPLTKDGKIADDSRVKDAVKTIQWLVSKKVKVILLNKIGRPDGKRVKKLSNLVVAQRLQQLLKKKVLFCDELLTDKVNAAVTNLMPGEILMLENVRFWPGEAENDLSFAKTIATYGAVYVNEAFSVCHRQEATVSALSGLLPSYAGLSLMREVTELNNVLTKKVKPKIAIIGGAKIDTKVELIKNLSASVDKILLGGAIANAVLAAQGCNLGKSAPSEKELAAAKLVLSDKLVLPTDVVVAKSINSKGKTVATEGVGAKDLVLDIGGQTAKNYSQLIATAKMVVWNGPVGLFEKSEFKKGTTALAKAMAKTNAYSVCGGGETLLALKENKATSKVKFVSMAGGAMLAYLSGEGLPGLKNLYQK